MLKRQVEPLGDRNKKPRTKEYCHTKALTHMPTHPTPALRLAHNSSTPHLALIQSQCIKKPPCRPIFVPFVNHLFVLLHAVHLCDRQITGEWIKTRKGNPMLTR